MHEPPHARLEKDLISGGEDEVGKLQFYHWPQPHDRRPDARADHDILRDGRVEDAVRTEALPQAFSDAEDTSPHGYVLPVENDVVIALQLFRQGLVDCFAVGDHRHRLLRFLGARCWVLGVGD